jgi:L-threonylcarbamoyladenylate synthase
MTDSVRIAEDGAAAARRTLEDCIRSGGVALFPADTVYGLACDPESDAAVERMHALKGRGRERPAAVMFFDENTLAEALPDLGPRASAACSALLPGPVTLVLPNPRGRFPLAGGPDPSTLGVRLIEGPLAGTRTPVMQTSANPTGGEDPRAVTDVAEGIRSAVDLVIDAGELPGTPSTVVDLTRLDAGGDWSVLREGALAASRVSELLSP